MFKRLVLWAVLLAVPAYAQTDVFNPTVTGYGFGVTVIDATTQPGADMCAKISAAANAIYAVTPQGGVVDARGFSGTQNCAASISSGWPNTNNFAVTVKLGPVLMLTAVTQVVPPGAMMVGISPFVSEAVGSVIQVSSSSFTASTPVVDLGNVSYTTPAGISGVAVHCDPPTGTPPTGCIGVRNLYGEEGTTINNVQVYGATDTCYDIESNGTGGPQNGGPYYNLGCGVGAGPALLAGATCMRIGGSTASQIIGEFYQISCAGNVGVSQAASLVAFDINGEAINLHDSHVESYVTGVEIGAKAAASDVRISNLNCAASASYPTTSAIDISSAHASQALWLENIDCGGANTTNVVKDNLTNGFTVTAGAGPMSLYQRGLSNQVFGLPGGNWVNSTPAPSSGSGTITTASSAIKAQLSPGHLATVNGVITVTTAGTGAGSLNLTLPFTAVGDSTCTAFEYNVGTYEIAYINGTTATLQIYAVSYGSPIANSKVFKFTCVYQSQ
jgi:hypothetical protein